MATAGLKGKVQTGTTADRLVLGPVSPDELGVTLSHEHVLVKFMEIFFKKPEYGSDCLEDLQFKMENLGKIRQYPYSVRTNLVLDDPNEIIEELKLYKQAGGRTVCDVTSVGHGRTKTEDLPRISRESGVQIIAATGFYIDCSLPSSVKAMSEREMADFLVREIVEGVGGSGVRCGVIGEVGCSWPLTEYERKSLQAAAIAQKETGAPLIIHPGIDERSPFEALDILENAGADISHTVMCHLGRTITNDRRLLELARRGCYLEYDCFGVECSHYHWDKTKDFLSDAQRIQKVKLLVDNGFADRILLSHCLHSKHRLVRYGGHGYAHILEYVVPKMADRGISRDTAMEILTTNPKNWLTFQ